jgi:PAS domain S-box-containing protein
MSTVIRNDNARRESMEAAKGEWALKLTRGGGQPSAGETIESVEPKEALRTSFRNVCQQITEYAIFNMEPGGAIETWNKGCRQILGYDEVEFLKMNGEQLFVPEDVAAGVPEAELKMAAEKGLVDEDRWMMRKNGERFWASGTTTALRDDDGRLVGFAKVMRDLTGNRGSQKETRRNLERLRFLSEVTRSLLETRDPVELLDRIYDGLADILGLDFYFHYIVDTQRRTLRLGAYRGVSVEGAKDVELLDYGQNVCGTVARDRKPIIVSDAQHTTEAMTEAIRSQGITAYACHPLIANGELLGTLSFGTSRFLAFTPEVVSVMRVLSDIVAVAIARKRADERLAERARLLDISRDAIIVRNMDHRVVYWNHGAEVLFGWTEAEALGKDPCTLLRCLLPEPLERIVENIYRDGYWEGELIQTAKDGRRITALSTASLARDERGQPRGFLQTYTDITELKRVERELAKANEELKDYACNLEAAVRERTTHLQETIAELESVSYSLSHDMRAPLRAINSFSQIVLAQAEEKLGPLEKDLLQKSISAAERLDRLISDILIYTRVARGPAPLTSVDVERLLRQIIAERPELQPPRADISIEGPLGSVCCHEAHLTQCITNLLDNAVKFVAPGTPPCVHIRSEALDGKIRLWFEDNGIGISHEAQQRIFGIFERMHDEHIYPGTGIGLAIVRKAAERMGGSVGVESEPGKGSRFWVQLTNAEKSPGCSSKERIACPQ